MKLDPQAGLYARLPELTSPDTLAPVTKPPKRYYVRKIGEREFDVVDWKTGNYILRSDTKELAKAVAKAFNKRERKDAEARQVQADAAQHRGVG